MGLVKRDMMEREEQEYLLKRDDWIRLQLEDEDADEDTDGWYELSDEWDALHEADYEYDEWDMVDEWDVVGKSRYELFTEQMHSVESILEVDLPHSSYNNLLIMLYAHIISAIELYLSSEFIGVVLSNDLHMRRLVETDPEFAKQRFSIKEIYSRKAKLNHDLAKYLKNLIFHNIAKIKPMFLSVLNIDFGDVEWLYEAVNLRHHCVHRAGYDKDGNEIDISKEVVSDLLVKAESLVKNVSSGITKQDL